MNLVQTIAAACHSIAAVEEKIKAVHGTTCTPYALFLEASAAWEKLVDSVPGAREEALPRWLK
jgi:hypothetical protein